MYPRTEMLDLVVVDGRARGIVVRDLVTGPDQLARGGCGGARHGRLRNVYLPLDQREGLQRHRHLARRTSGAPLFANPCFTQIHPTCIPAHGEHQSKLTLMSESLRNDGRIWVPQAAGRHPARPATSPRPSATTTSSGCTRASATSCRATSPRAAPRTCATRDAASARAGTASTSISATRSSGCGRHVIAERYGNLFEMYERITGGEPLRGADAHLPRARTTPWAACGWTTT